MLYNQFADETVLKDFPRNTSETVFTAELSRGQARIPQVDRAVIIGGDGSLHLALNQLAATADGDDLPVIGLPGGGSNNLMRELLRRRGYIMSAADFVNTPSEEMEGLIYIRPGQVDGNTIFANQIGLGAYEKLVGKYNDSRALRSRPKGQRQLLANAGAAMMARPKGEHILNIYSMLPKIGERNTFPNQNMQSATLTNARIDGTPFEQYLKLLRTLKAWNSGKQPSENVLHVEQREIFNAKTYLNDMWIDGDTYEDIVLPGREFTVRRAGNPVRLVALI